LFFSIFFMMTHGLVFREGRQSSVAANNRVEGKLNVHIIPHTHDDVGWLKTVDQYYYGSKNDIAHGAVATIISATVNSLLDNPDRKFIYVEQAFFQRWWEEQSEVKQTQVRSLVASGQLEFVNGGWCMHDEASPSYIDMIDQTTLGHRLIMEQFGVAPKATWQIDPFGHSGFQASMLSSPLAGFNSVFFARSDYQDFANRQKHNATEFFWFPSPSQGKSAATLGGILADYYYPPQRFNFGGDDKTPPIMDDSTMHDYNVKERVDDFVHTVTSFSSFTAGSDVMVMMGTDFSYENAETWFRNIDKLIKYCNQDGRVNVLYSTPSIYAAAKIGSTVLPERNDDMMPYADDAHAVWAGYFTSRAALKGYVRETSSVLTAGRQLQLLAGGAAAANEGTGKSNPLYLLERAMGVAQHHDAVSGTSKQAVAFDYAQRLAEGRGTAQRQGISEFLKSLTASETEFVACDLANVTICPALERSDVTTAVVVFNSQSSSTSSNILLPVPFHSSAKLSFKVFNAAAAPVPAQLFPASQRDLDIKGEYYRYKPLDRKVGYLAFQAQELPAMGYDVYFIEPTSSDDLSTQQFTTVSLPRRVEGKEMAAAQLSNGVATLTFGADGRTSSLTTKDCSAALVQDFVWYNSSSNGGPDDKTGDWQQKSGAYIFRPNSTTKFPVAAGAVSLDIIEGPVVSVARQVFASWATQDIFLWAGEEALDFEFTVGPIPQDDGNGKEVVSVFSSDISSQSVWYTDSNGRDSMKRQRNHRPSWNLTVREPVADNYYPVNFYQFLGDDSRVLSVVTDRTQGGSSLADGQLEFMVHRRLVSDDNRGVAEPLDEPGVNGRGLIVRGVHRLALSTPSTAAAARRGAQAAQAFRRVVQFSALSASESPSSWVKSHTPTKSLLTKPLPPNVQVVTAHAQGNSTLLLRIGHMFEQGDGAPLDKSVTVSLQSLFSGFSIQSAVEMTLTGNVPLAKAPSTTYTTNSGSYTLPVVPGAPQGPAFAVTVSPMQIRTFMCKMQAD